jgi:NADH-quinone oxidoreductase subunit N
VLASLLAATEWAAPKVDYHALLPEIILAAVIVVVILADLFLEERSRWITATIAGFGLLAAAVPLITLAVDGSTREALSNSAYIVDDYALVLKMLFLLAGYVVVLLSTTYVEEGGYYQGEYYTLLLCSILGMVMMASSRDLISIFIALEFLSIPAYMLAAWRKRDLKSNEAGMKYFLLGVFASAVMLYGMTLLYGETGSTVLSTISLKLQENNPNKGLVALAVVFIIVGFAFKVSAVPFHTWAPDTYEGAPTPVTAFLSVASKAAGFVALLTLVVVGFGPMREVWQPLFWVLAALSMTVGNLLALRQTNMVRMLAYSSVAQGGFILMPLATLGYSTQARQEALTAVVTYLVVYAAMNLGAFAVVMALARKTRSGEISSFGGLINYAPSLAVVMTLFLAALAGIPPAGGWIAKFYVFKAVMSAGGWGVALGCVGVVNSVLGFAYYGNVMREIWMRPVPDDDRTPVPVPQSLGIALGITGIVTLAIGVIPNIVLRFGNLSQQLGGALPGQ